MKEQKQTKPLTRLQILLIVSVASMCLLGFYLYQRTSDNSALSPLDLTETPSNSRSVTIPLRDVSDEKPRATSSSQLNEMTSYFPADLRYLRFGIPLVEFKSLEPNLIYETFEGIRMHASKKTTLGGITEITAYFELADPNLYYELIVVFASETQRDQSAASLLGNPNFGNDWLIPLNDQTALHVWTAFDDKLVYKYLPGGIATVYDDSPSPAQMQELQKLIEELEEIVRIQNQETKEANKMLR